MADHKAPTEVTVVAGDEPSRLSLFVHKHWTKAALVALVIAAGVLYSQYQAGQDAKVVNQSWSRLMSAVDEDGRGGFAPDAEAIAAMQDELSGTAAGAWSLYMEAQGQRKDGDYDAALATLQEIKAAYPEHPLVKDRKTYGESATPLNAIERLTKVFTSERDWHASQPQLFANAELPADAPRVRFQTDHGDFVVGLYADRAPKHVENFLAKVNDGYYEGLKFHRSAFGMMIETGDPTTRDAGSDPIRWGQTGSDDVVEDEDSGLFHFGGVLSANTLAGAEGSDGGLISFTAQAVHFRDGANVVFGAVIEGLDVVEEIAQLAPDATGQRPAEPAIVESATVVPGA